VHNQLAGNAAGKITGRLPRRFPGNLNARHTIARSMILAIKAARHRTRYGRAEQIEMKAFEAVPLHQKIGAGVM